MAIPALAIVVGILAASGGVSLGALIRQPQINELKAQVLKLQKELDKMQTIVRDVLKDIEILSLKMQLQQNEDILNQLKGKDEMDIGKLVYAYGLKEYLEIKQKYLILNEDISEEEAVFADAFAMFLDNRIPSGNDGVIQKKFIRGYLMERYHNEIENFVAPDLEELVSKLKDRVKGVREKEQTERKIVNQKLIPELECLSLTPEQARFLYSLELMKIEYDIRATQKDAEKTRKITWKDEWMKSILAGLGREKDTVSYFIRDAEFLYGQMRRVYEESLTKTWYYLVVFEATLFVPYFPLEENEKSNKPWDNLRLGKDYMREEFCMRQMVVDKVLLDKMSRIFNKQCDMLSGKSERMAMTMLITTVMTVATGGLASYFAPGIAAAMFGGSLAHLSGQALINASLAFVGGGSLAAGGLGMAGGAALITGGGALLGMAGSSASTIAAMVLLTTKGYARHECAKLLTFSSVVLIDELHMKSMVSMIQKSVEKCIGEFGGQLAQMKAMPDADKKAMKTISTNLAYLEKCNKKLLLLVQSES